MTIEASGGSVIASIAVSMEDADAYTPGNGGAHSNTHSDTRCAVQMRYQLHGTRAAVVSLPPGCMCGADKAVRWRATLIRV